MGIGKSESASFWMGVLTDFKARGVEDILITVTENLSGFTDTIKNVFPRIDYSDMCSKSNPQLLSLCGVEREERVFI